jgi:anti-anti-sigma factor
MTFHSPDPIAVPLVCSPRLTSEHRVEFRRDALHALDAAMAIGAQSVTLDLGAVVEVDASGLGVLILLQKRAREVGMRTRLVQVPGIVEQLFEDTRLAPLFEIVRAS